ncbi:MAG: IS1634 family transposase [bacterium]
MYLKTILNKKTGRIFLSIVHGYRDKSTGKSCSKTIKPLGYLDELQKEVDDPIAYYTQVAKEMNEKHKASKVPLVFEFQAGDIIDRNAVQRKKLGHAPFSKIYHELGIHQFMINRQRSLKIGYQLNEVMKMLLFQRILEPASKLKNFERKDRYFGKYAFSLADTYRSLSLFSSYKEDLLLFLHKQVIKLYGRDTSNVFYDVTNYYFEIDKPDKLRKKGISKEHRPNPIVQMGLLLDRLGLPITYKLFSGNTNDCNTLLPVLSEVRERYDIGRMVVVADKGLNTSDNIAYNLIKGDGYIYSQTIRGANRELKAYVLNQSGYRQMGEEFKIKSRCYPREITVTDPDGKQVKVPIEEKQVIFYSENYAKRAKAEREPALAKARELIANPGQFSQATSYGAAKYIKDLLFDKKTGEIITAGHAPELDLEKLNEEEEFDGYYAIVTSECNLPDEEIIDTYRGLWRIEESFRITKSDLETRPVYVSLEDHIEAHFLTCFVALLLLRILELKTQHKYSPARMIESLNAVSGAHLQQNYYMFDYYDDVVEHIGNTLGIDFSKRIIPWGEIRSLLAATKK